MKGFTSLANALRTSAVIAFVFAVVFIVGYVKEAGNTVARSGKVLSETTQETYVSPYCKSMGLYVFSEQTGRWEKVENAVAGRPYRVRAVFEEPYTSPNEPREISSFTLSVDGKSSDVKDVLRDSVSAVRLPEGFYRYDVYFDNVVLTQYATQAGSSSVHVDALNGDEAVARCTLSTSLSQVDEKKSVWARIKGAFLSVFDISIPHAYAQVNGYTTDFTTSLTGPSCMTRIPSENVGTFTLTIENTTESDDSVSKFVIKLPEGMEYETGSTTIDGVIADESMLTVNTVGNSQELVWENPSGWDVEQGDSMVVVYRAIAGDQALTGTALMESVVTPSDVQADSSTLRASHSFEIAQSCTVPSAGLGLLDNTRGVSVVGGGLFVTAYLLAKTNLGVAVMLFVIEMPVFSYIGTQMRRFWLAQTDKRKYFEKSAEEDW